jgi:hypothetical protein
VPCVTTPEKNSVCVWIDPDFYLAQLCVVSSTKNTKWNNVQLKENGKREKRK